MFGAPSSCGIRIQDTYNSELGPTLKSDNEQIQDKTCRVNGSSPRSKMGRFDHSTTRVLGYPKGTPSLQSDFVYLTR